MSYKHVDTAADLVRLGCSLRVGIEDDRRTCTAGGAASQYLRNDQLWISRTCKFGGEPLRSPDNPHNLSTTKRHQEAHPLLQTIQTRLRMRLPVRGFARTGALSKQRNARTSRSGLFGSPASGLHNCSPHLTPTGRT